MRPIPDPTSPTIHAVLEQALGRQPPSFWYGFGGKRILMSGGTGFFGQWVAGLLLAADRTHQLGLTLRLITRSPERARMTMPHITDHPRVILEPCDLAWCRPADAPADLVIHGAADACATLNTHHPEAMLRTVVDGTRHMLSWATRHHPERFLFVSSGAIYGRQPLDMTHLHEEWQGGPDPLQVDSAYAEGKRVAEQWCAATAREQGIAGLTIARPFAFSGPWLPVDRHFAIGNLMGDLVAGRPLTLHGDGTAIRSYLDGGDLAVWLLTILMEGTPLRPYNVGSSEAITLAELQAAIAALIPGGVPFSISQRADPRRPAHRYVPDVRRAREELQLEAWTDLGTSLRSWRAWLEGH